MDDLVQAVVDEVLRRQGQRPALLVGRAPQAAAGWRFVTDGPYEAVILGSLTAAELLRFPDEASAQALLEGRAGLLVDGLPLGYLAPVDLGYLMTSAEDRGTDFVSASFLRVLRYAALLLGLLLPGLYVAMAAFHPQMLPTELLQSILESKRAVPFPTIVEVLGLLAAFELLQEASVSLPQSVGQSLSIIGGLVVGSAAQSFETFVKRECDFVALTTKGSRRKEENAELACRIGYYRMHTDVLENHYLGAAR